MDKDDSIEDIGGFTDDVEGDIETRKVQKDGRVNIPPKMLAYIGCEEGENVMLFAEDGAIEIRESSTRHIKERDD